MSSSTYLPTSPLFVPVQLDALVVNNDNKTDQTKWKDLSLNIRSLKNYGSSGSLGSSMERSINQAGGKNTSRTKDNGIHLHWTLPKAFRHGIFNRSGNTWDYPLVPNRWLVVRSDQKFNLKTWILESDYIDESATKDYNWIQNNQIGDNPPTYKFQPLKIGRVLDYKGWSEKNTKPMFLTIMAPGNPEFSSSYLHCKNVFGFHDPMDGAQDKSVFSYRVYGWYSDPLKDPLATTKTINDFKSKMNSFSWIYDNKDAEITNIPNGVICHSLIHGVTWSAKTESQVPSISGIKVGIGNSTSEALGVLLKNNISGDQLTLPPKLLAAFQYKCLEDNGMQKNWTRAMEQQMHKTGFTTTDSGSIWVVDQKEKNEIGKQGQQEIEVPKPFRNTISTLLVHLNNLQDAYDSKLDALRSHQAQLYALKYKKVYAFTDDSQADQISDSDWKKYYGDNAEVIDKAISDELQNVKTLNTEVALLKRKRSDLSEKEVLSEALNTYEGKIIDAYNSLSQAMALDSELKDFELKEILKPAFYESKDPAIVIDGLNPSERYTGSNQIKVRTSDQVAKQITIAFEDHNYLINANKIFTNPLTLGSEDVNNLFLESLFFDSGSYNSLASIVKDNSGTTTDLSKIIEQISKLEVTVEILSREDSKKVVIPEPFCASSWKQPWIPLFMEWEVTWKSTYSNPSISEVFKEWDFGNETTATDFKLKDGTRFSSDISKFRGRTTLAHDLVDKVEELEKKLETDLFKTMRPMSQQLAGLSSQLIMRDSSIQLPILSKKLESDTDLQFIGDEYSWNPMPNNKSFYPYRGGVFKINYLRVIDAFGQVIEVIDPNRPTIKPDLYNSVGLPTYIDKDNFVLAPRIIQPSRLRFDWLSANSLHQNRISDSDPGTNPVCGWLLYNKLNHSISIFESDGKELGEHIETSSGVTFVPPPRKEIADSNTSSDGISIKLPPEGNTSTISNLHLKNLVKAIEGNIDAFNGIIDRINKNQISATPKASQQQITMALPIGNPIALVEAVIKLELKDLPAPYQYWKPDDVDPNYLENLRIKTFIGDETSRQDGLLGFFEDENFNTLNLPFGGENEIKPNIYFKQNSHIEIGVDSSIHISMLIDPRIPVKVSSGILPLEKISLPLHLLKSSMQAINLRFLVAPLLTPISELQMPLPKKPGANWNYITMDGQTTIEQKPTPTLPQSLKYSPLHSIEGWLTIKNTKITQ